MRRAERLNVIEGVVLSDPVPVLFEVSPSRWIPMVEAGMFRFEVALLKR